MQLVPTEAEMLALLRERGALRDGHFEYSNGVHTNQHVDPAHAMRSYETARILAAALSRKLRANGELRAILSEVSLVAATPAGLPLAYGLGNVLDPRQVYWAEKPAGQPMRFRPYVTPEPREKVILVDDILRSGQLLAEARELLQRGGAEVVALAVLVHQPTPATVSFGELPIYTLVRLQPRAYTGPASCDLCRAGVPVLRIGEDWKAEEDVELAAAARP